MKKSEVHLVPHFIQHMSESLKALGHPHRLRLFEALASGEKSVGTLVQELGIPQSIVSQQLRIMRSGQVVISRRLGSLALYKLAHPGLFELLKCLQTCQKYCMDDHPSA